MNKLTKPSIQTLRGIDGEDFMSAQPTHMRGAGTGTRNRDYACTLKLLNARSGNWQNLRPVNISARFRNNSSAGIKTSSIKPSVAMSSRSTIGDCALARRRHQLRVLGHYAGGVLRFGWLPFRAAPRKLIVMHIELQQALLSIDRDRV